MKICFIIQGLKKGGAERVISELSNHFSADNNDVYIILTESDNPPAYPLSDNVNLIYLEKKKRNVMLNRINGIFSLKRTISEINPDICISFITRTNVYSIIACRLVGKKIIVSERNDPARDPKGKVMRILRKVFYRFSNGFIFQTEYAKEYFSKKIQKRSVVIPNPLSEKVITFKQRQEKKKKIVAIGRLEKQKNFPLLIKAFCNIMEEFPEYKLYIYGQGEEKESLERMIVENNAQDRVILFGQTDNIFEEISDAEIQVLSSDFEGMPNALAEGMAIGLSCISTDCPAYGSAYLIENMKNGVLVPVGDEKKMAEAIRLLITDEKLRNEISKEAVNIKNEFSLDNIGKLWIDYIKNILDWQD